MAGLSVMSGVASGQLVTAGDDGRGRGGEELGSFGKALLVESGKEAHTALVAVGRAGRSHSLQPLWCGSTVQTFTFSSRCLLWQ